MKRVSTAFRLAILCLACALCARGAEAQRGRPRAEVTPLLERSPVHAGDRVRLALKVTLPEGLHTQSNNPRDPLLIPTELTIDPNPAFTVDEIVWPPSTDLIQQGQDKPLAVFEHEFLIGVQLTTAASTPAGSLKVPVQLRYQACDANLCYPPTTASNEWAVEIVPASASAGPVDPARAKIFEGIKFGTGVRAAESTRAAGAANAEAPKESDIAKLAGFTVLGTTGGYLGQSDFLKFVHDAESGVKQRGMFEGRGPLMILFLVLVGGLALNLTPCVLPMIPINLAIIGAGTQVGFDRGFPSRMRGFALGAIYGGAMAIVYGVLGAFVILTAGSFGTINASPWFNAAIAIVFVVLGLAMFDVIMIDFSSLSSRFRPDARTGSFVLAFSMGAVAALLAGACVAPVVIQVVLFSSNLYATGTKVALALPFFLGLGMAIPWPIAGAGIAALPKPGMWMVRVKQGFGVLILVTAAYYGYEAYSIMSNRWVDAADVKSSVAEQLKSGWHASLGDGLDAAAREQKPVLIDMWATWCKNCLTMDKTTLRSAEVQSALSGYVKIKFQAEDPDAQPAKSLMQKFDAVGLPAYVILRPATTGARR